LPHALYGAAVCFTNLKKPNEAAELIEILKKNHSRSVWTAKTLKELAD